MISEENILKYYKDLRERYLPSYLDEIPEEKEVMRLNSREMARVNFLFQDVLNQLNVDTATWGLRIYEDFFKIPYNPKLTYEERRKIIKSYMVFDKSTTTDVIKKIASAYAETVDIIRHDKELWLDIVLETTHGFDNFIKILMEKINRIIPTHIGTHYTLISKEEYNHTMYLGSTLVNANYYLLTNDVSDNYKLENSQKLGSTLSETRKYLLTNDIKENYISEANNKNASVMVNTKRYILR